MRINHLMGAMAASLLFSMAIGAADDRAITRMATCQDSWFDWKDDPVRTGQFRSSFLSAFVQKPDQSFFVPKSSLTVVGLPVLKAFPESVGMGVGFSVTVGATFDAAKKAVEKELGKTLKGCETGDHMRMCDLEVAEKKVVSLMAADTPGAKETLIGCYYFYAK